jgi:hypothetical protein
MFTPGWRNWQTRQLEGLVLRIRGAGSIPVPGSVPIYYFLFAICYLGGRVDSFVINLE